MDTVETISGKLVMTELELIQKIDIGRGWEGYYVLSIPSLDKDGEYQVFDEHYYANEPFLRPGYKFKGAIKHLGGFTGEFFEGDKRGIEKRNADLPWEGYVIYGKVIEPAYLGTIVDIGIHIHCHFMLMHNLVLIEECKKKGISITDELLVRPKPKNVITAMGGMYVYLLKELSLTCAGCGKRSNYLTTTLPTVDENATLWSVCRNCKHEQVPTAFPEHCEKCKKIMWQWKGYNFEIPKMCACGSYRYDFFFDHKPVYIDGKK
jgi:hypothetical protein